MKRITNNMINSSMPNTKGLMAYLYIANIYFLNAMYFFPHYSNETKGNCKFSTSQIKYRATSNGYCLSQLSTITRPNMTDILNSYLHALYLNFRSTSVWSRIRYI